MKRHAALALLPLATLGLIPSAAAERPAPPARTVKAMPADLQFQSISQRILAEAMRLSPVEATAMGEHKYDALLPDRSAAGRAERRRTWQQLLAWLGGIDPVRLSRGNQVNLALLRNELRYRIWQDLDL